MNSSQKPSAEVDEMIELEPEWTEDAIDELLRVAHSRLNSRLERFRRPQARVAAFDSRLGRLLAADGPRGLLALQFMDCADTRATIAALRESFDLAEDESIASEIGAEIERLLNGDSDAIAARAVDLTLVRSDFQRAALKKLRQVPAGSVVTYQSLAAAVGSPSSQRAIGNTVASNPIPIYLPCHRVIRSDGTIGNYGGGVERKLKLLRAEGFSADRESRVPPEAVYGHWTSRIFCRPGCSAVRRAERRRWIIFADSLKARGAGMRACKLCRPE
jgi:O-6-methylguanine DNA methyltransferase